MKIIKNLIGEVKDGVLNDYLNDIPVLGTLGRLGGFGGITFKVGQNKTLVPKDYSVSVGNETISHSRIGSPPITEYTNRKLKTLNMDIKLIYTLAPVQRNINKLIDMCELGEHYTLIVGNQKIGDQHFIIKSFNYKITKTNGAGVPIVAECSLQFEEYINNIEKRRTDKFVIEKGIKKIADDVVKDANKKVKETISKINDWRE
ncbi:MAG: phage tail protein [Fusobacteriaceae bacterium]